MASHRRSVPFLLSSSWKCYACHPALPICALSLDFGFHPFLDSIHPAPLTEYEMAFGLDGHTAPILLRNWLTFKFREVVSSQEILAYDTPGLANARMIKSKVNREVTAAVHQKYEYCCATNSLPFFTKHFQCIPDFVVISPDDFEVLTFFPL